MIGFPKFFWVKNEWERAVFDNPNSIVNKKLRNKKGTGWADKLCHLLLHLLIMVFLPPVMRAVFGVNLAIVWCIVISEIWGFGYEWIFDCVIRKDGASKWDLVFNNLGMVIGGIILWVYGQPWV